MKKETTPVASHSLWKNSLFAAVFGLFLLTACETNKPADQEAKDRDDATTDITEDADPDSTVESPATTGYIAPPAGPKLV
ncbi:hypothetical protein [Rufibacter sp. XAAS-G3-1]|uniref:hypothetical protein n=1 Tax=Rufibacter sp. XAAS-G3-1 TaxID=2729134 RepID=UPI0015E642BD|nr:hypothetical protein [Rufibacter sp. XAAS-G3-1]